MRPREMVASTGPMFARPLDWALGVIAEAGYDAAELMITQDPATQEPERIIAAAEREGVRISVVHGPFLLLTRRVFGTDLVEKAVRSLDVASAIGAAVMIVHPPLRWQREFHRWLVEDAEGMASTAGTVLAVENLYPIPLLGRSVRLHRYTEPEHLAPFTNLVLDTSHFGVADVDIRRAWHELRHATTHLHVSDNRGHGRDSHAPLGHGVLPLASFMRSVADSDYGGAMTLELDCRRYLDDRGALVGYLRHELQKANALLEGAPAEEVLGRPDEVTSDQGD